MIAFHIDQHFRLFTGSKNGKTYCLTKLFPCDADAGLFYVSCCVNFLTDDSVFMSIKL